MALGQPQMFACFSQPLLRKVHYLLICAEASEGLEGPEEAKRMATWRKEIRTEEEEMGVQREREKVT